MDTATVPPATVTLKLWLAVIPIREPVTETVKLYVPGVVGVPERVAVEVEPVNVRPGGNVPVCDQLKGPGPLAAVNVWVV